MDALLDPTTGEKRLGCERTAQAATLAPSTVTKSMRRADFGCLTKLSRALNKQRPARSQTTDASSLESSAHGSPGPSLLLRLHRTSAGGQAPSWICSAICARVPLLVENAEGVATVFERPFDDPWAGRTRSPARDATEAETANSATHHAAVRPQIECHGHQGTPADAAAEESVAEPVKRSV